MDLIKVDEQGKCTARELYEFLELEPSQFARWAKTNITENIFVTKNEDYEEFDINIRNPKGGRPGKDYYLTIEFAKMLCMTSQTNRRKQAIDYFIEVERKLKLFTPTPQQYLIPQSFSEALLLAYRQQIQIEEQKEQLAVTTPKAKYFDNLIECGLILNSCEIAKKLGIPERNFITALVKP